MDKDFRDAQMGQTGLNEKAYTKLMAEIDNEKTGLKVACLRIDCSDAQQHVKECVAYGKPYPRQTGLEEWKDVKKELKPLIKK